MNPPSSFYSHFSDDDIKALNLNLSVTAKKLAELESTALKPQASPSHPPHFTVLLPDDLLLT